MKSLGQVQLRGMTLDLHSIGHYRNGREALRLSCADGSPYATLTVNLPEAPELEPGHFYVKTWEENAPVAAAVLKAGLMVDTGRRVEAGFVVAQVWQLG